MRKNAPGEYFHVYNRGTQKQLIFNDDQDRLRFLFLILTFQGAFTVTNIGRKIKESVQHRMLNISSSLMQEVVKERLVELITFTLMDNHFHLIVKEVKNGGLAKYIQKVSNAYTKYFNTKYETSGHLFQGSYKNTHIETDEQLMYVSAYSHRNPIELGGWRDNLDRYPWSSYQDFIHTNRWGDLLVTNVILERFVDHLEYKKFVESSTAKENKEITK